MREDIRSWAVWSGRLLLAALLLFLLQRNIETVVIMETLRAANPWFLATAVLLLFPNVFLQYRKWGLLLRSAYPLTSSRDIRASLLLGFTFGIVTPARIGEFGGRAVAVKGASKFRLVGLTAIDKLATLIITVLMGGVGLLVFCIQHPFMNPYLLALIEVLLVVGSVLFFRLKKFVVQDEKVAEDPGFFRRRMLQLREAFRSVDDAVRRRLILYSLLFYATFLTQFLLLLWAFGPVEPVSALAGISTIMLLKTIIPPVTLGELGIREGASVYVLGYAGVIAASAFSAALLLFAINILLPSLAGLLVFLRRPTSQQPL
jgi:uncharacterized membrane protein YbhN (UPF0104 family)